MKHKSHERRTKTSFPTGCQTKLINLYKPIMDKYKENFEKGPQHYIQLLEEINWFSSPYVNKEELLTTIENCTFPPYYGTYLAQYAFDSEYDGLDLLEDVLNYIQQVIPTFQFEIQTDKILVSFSDTTYSIPLDIASFELGESPTNFFELAINPLLEQEKSAYFFYELPPADQCSSLVFAKPAVYNQALERGVIPDFMGYYAINY